MIFLRIVLEQDGEGKFKQSPRKRHRQVDPAPDTLHPATHTYCLIAADAIVEKRWTFFLLRSK
jgi:hypothetical protein